MVIFEMKRKELINDLEIAVSSAPYSHYLRDLLVVLKDEIHENELQINLTDGER